MISLKQSGLPPGEFRDGTILFSIPRCLLHPLPPLSQYARR
jgi:hypothetical protein